MKCPLCKKDNTNHFPINCPLHCTIRGCDADKPPIRGCNEPHTTEKHWCYCCNEYARHITKECPLRCRVKGCNKTHKDQDHECFCCRKEGAHHLTWNCPYNLKIISRR